jgi:hypothetical protein
MIDLEALHLDFDLPMREALLGFEVSLDRAIT